MNEKDIDDFIKKYRAEDYQKNKEYYKEYNKKYIRDYNLKNNYGIDSDEYNIIFLKQDGKCAICGAHQSNERRALDVDHDHTTSVVRGLLCNACNKAIGLLNEDISILQSAIEYLEKHK